MTVDSTFAVPPWTAETRKTVRDNVQVAWQMLGADRDGPPLVMVMGLTGVKEDWRRLATTLAERRPTIVIDNRGMGESDVPEAPWTIEDMARDTLAIADDVGWDSFNLLGISMGGMISQTLALIAPDRIRRLVLGCTTHGGKSSVSADADVLARFSYQPGTDVREFTRELQSINYPPDWLDSDPDRVEALVDFTLAYRRPTKGFMKQMGAIMQFDVSGDLDAISIETLVVHGDADILLPHENGVMIADKITPAVLHTITGAGHVFWDSHHEESERVINDFLAS